jgi:hypothetical protein
MRKLVVHALGAHLDLGPERQQSASRRFRSPVASVLGSLLVRVRLLPRAAVVGHALGVLPLLPLPHARLSLREPAVLPRAIPAELSSRLLLPALHTYRERRRANARRLDRERRTQDPEYREDPLADNRRYREHKRARLSDTDDG